MGPQHHEKPGIVAAAGVPARIGHEGFDVRILADDIGDALLVIHHLVEGSSLRRLDVQLHLVIVGVRYESLGDLLIQKPGGSQHGEEQHGHDGAMAQNAAQGPVVEAQHRLEHAIGGAIDQPVFLSTSAQEAAAQHRRQGDGHHSGNQDGGANGHREFPEHAAQGAAHEQNRDEHGRQR